MSIAVASEPRITKTSSVLHVYPDTLMAVVGTIFITFFSYHNILEMNWHVALIAGGVIIALMYGLDVTNRDCKRMDARREARRAKNL